MTLTEYLNQETPRFMPHVYLSDGEFSVGHFKGAIGHKFASLWINGIDGIEYAIKENSPTIWTTDSDGNPKTISCFHLPHDYKTK